MASRIQGITVEIGGDTTKLSKTVGSVSTDMQVLMKQKSAFTGKKILFLGDSITALNTSEVRLCGGLHCRPCGISARCDERK